MNLSESPIFKSVIKAIGVFFLGFIAIFIPTIGPILFLFSLIFGIRILYHAWLLSEREFAVANRDNVPNIIFDPRRSIDRGYEDDDSISKEFKK